MLCILHSLVKNDNGGVPLVKLPHDVRRWLEAKSSYNQTPMTAEILRALRERMEREAS